MNILKKMLEKLKNIFIKRKEIAMLQVGQEYSNNERENFKSSLKVKREKISKNKRVESHICYGDGLGIKKKIEA